MLLLVVALLAAFTDALWIGENLSDGVKAESEKNCPVFRKAFDLPSEPVESKVTAAGLGFFEVYVNGEKVGDEVLAPAACDWTHRCYYYVWDVGSRLRKGANEVRVWTVPGYSDDFFQYGWRRVAECPKRTKLSLEGVLSDGAAFEVDTDADWQVSPRSPISYASIYMGERYDAGFGEWDWMPAKVLDDFDRQEVVNRVAGLWRPREGPPELRLYDGAPVRAYDFRRPRAILRPNESAHAFVVDAGVNRAGAVRIRSKGPRGATLTLSYAEEIDTRTNDIDTRTNRTADRIRDTFTLAGTGDWETYAPRFTYHGFRYVRVDGYPGELTVDDVECYAIGADVATTGGFECSDQFLNRFHAAAVNSMRSNFVSYPTDCCMRKERTPCQMDSMVYEETAMFNFDLRAFYRTWLDNIALGSIGGTRNPDWMGDGVVLPWRYYMFYGDRTVLERNYPFAKRKLDLMLEENPDCVVTNGFGDWCAPNDGSRNYASAFSHVAEVNTAMLGHCCDVMARTAAELGLKGDAERYRAAYMRTKDAYNARFFDAAAGSYSEGDQLTTSLAIAMRFAEGEAKDRAYRAMIGRIRGRDGGKLTVGIFGLRYMGEVMADGGDGDLFISMIKGPAYPSFGYMFEQLDATSLWEQWHPYGGMTTHNHAMMSGVETWFFTRLLGISVGDGGVSVEVKPVFPDSLEWARGSVRLPCGIVDVEWHRENGKPVCRHSVRKSRVEKWGGLC